MNCSSLCPTYPNSKKLSDLECFECLLGEHIESLLPGGPPPEHGTLEFVEEAVNEDTLTGQQNEEIDK